MKQTGLFAYTETLLPKFYVNIILFVGIITIMLIIIYKLCKENKRLEQEKQNLIITRIKPD